MSDHPFVFFVHLKAAPAWLRLSREERNRRMAQEVGPILQRYPDVSHSHFDAEAFSGKVSDIEVFRTGDSRRFYHLWEELRDSSLVAGEFFEVVEIYPTIADGFEEFEAQRSPTKP